jgi:RNA polymerase sigma factor (sigma-70 family)
MAPVPVIHVIDDEEDFRRSVMFMLNGFGFDAEGYENAQDFMDRQPELSEQGGCILLDIRMPRMSGLELQRRLKDRGDPFPVIFMTGHGDVEQAVQAMKGGALDFLQKPFREQVLLDVVTFAVDVSLQNHRRRQQQEMAQSTLEKLTPREREVARWLALGLSNKEVGKELSISDNTVHVHRQRITEKIGSGHAADLARLFLRADSQGLDAPA